MKNSFAPSAPGRRISPIIVPHPAWMEALEAIERRASMGPGTILLVGPPGTGKSVLLRYIAGYLGRQGVAVTLVRQGDLPIERAEIGLLLVDEACRMAPDRLAEWVTQRREFVVLADTDRLAATFDAKTTVVRLRPLTESEAKSFALDWIGRTQGPDAVLSPDALARVAVHARGAVRLIVQLVGAAAAVGASTRMTALAGADIDEAATMRRNWMLAPEVTSAAVEPTDLPAPVVSSPRQTAKAYRGWRRSALVATALAACVVLIWALRPVEPSITRDLVNGAGRLPGLPVQTAESTPPTSSVAAFPAEEPADTPPSDRLPPPPARQLAKTEAPVTASPSLTEPPADTARPDRPTEPSTALAGPVAPRVGGEPTVSLPEPDLPTRSRGGRGLIVVAHRGDTLESLFKKLYRGRSTPSYAEVEAVNMQPVQPGAIVVFPAPPGGWSPAQR